MALCPCKLRAMPPTHPSQADVAAAYRTLIAHETEPKEQDFYRTRLQRLEQTTEPESDDFVTQLAVKQIEGEAAWWRSIDFDRNASRTFESMTGDSQQAVRTGVERVLAHLTAAGRLVPAGGRGLEFSEVEALRSAWEELKGYRVDWYARPYVNQMVKVVDALFPAAEHAEDAKPCGSNSVTLGWCKLTARHEGLHTNGTYLWGTPSEPDPPAPAEPAEEETKAEASDWCIGSMCRHAHIDGANRKHIRGSDCPPAPTQEQIATRGRLLGIARKILGDPSPVVPAPTETEVEPETWTCLNAVPVNVPKVVDSYGFTWRRSNDGWEYKTPNGWVPAIESVFHGSYVAAPTETEAGHA